jgi:hypothetical protein
MPKIERVGYLPCPCEQSTPFEMTHVEQNKEGGDHCKMEYKVEAEVHCRIEVAHDTNESEENEKCKPCTVFGKTVMVFVDQDTGDKKVDLSHDLKIVVVLKDMIVG